MMTWRIIKVISPGGCRLRLESNEGIAGHIHSMESFDLGLDYLLNYHDMIYSIGKDEILAAAQRYLCAEKMVVAVAGPQMDGAGA